MGFLGKAAAVKSLRTTVIQHRCKRRVRLPAGRVGEIWGRRQAEGCHRCRDRSCVSLYTDQRCHPLLCTCAQVTSDSSQ